MCGPALFHLHGEWQLECETEAVGVLKTGEFGWQRRLASTGYLVITHLEGQSLFGSIITLSANTALSKSCLCVSSSVFVR